MVQVEDHVASSIREYLEIRGEDDILTKPNPLHHRRLRRLLRGEVPSVVVRQATPATTVATASDSTISCGPNDTTGACERQSVSTTEKTTIPVVLGVLLPLTVALVLFLILHRRYLKNLRKEDAEDRFKSLDFGTDDVGFAHGKKSMEMSISETKDVLRQDRGLSMEIHMNTPYLLPPELNQSRESLRSLTKSLPDDDKYRTTDFIPDDGSIRPPSSIRHYGDETSSHTGSSRRKFDAESTKGLVRHAQASPLSAPPTRRVSTANSEKNINAMSLLPALATSSPLSSDDYLPSPLGTTAHPGLSMGAAINSSARQSQSPSPPQVDSIPHMKDVVSEQPTLVIPEIREPSPLVAATGFDFQLSSPPLDDTSHHGPPEPASSVEALHPENNVLAVPDFSKMRPESNYIDDEIPVAARPTSHYREEEVLNSPPKESSIREGHISTATLSEINYPNDHATHPIDEQNNLDINQEPNLPQLAVHGSDEFKQTANEKQSPRQVSETSSQLSTPSLAYNTTTSPQPQSQPESTLSTPQVEDRFSIYEDYYDEDEAFQHGDFIGSLGYDPRRLTMGVRPLPYDDPAEEPEQRANRIRSFYKEYFDETKPAPTQGSVFYYDGSESHYEDLPAPQFAPQSRSGYTTPRVQSQMRRPPQHRATISNGSFMSGSRIQSGMSSQFGYGPRQPKKNLPPPKPLSLLPTPHKLREDSALFMASDFAPPDLAKLQRSGTPDSLRGGRRAYTPSIQSHVPLASSFDDISVIPSPHALQNESTYTSLDFAPPPRIRGRESRANSDSGSIRSNRSGLSAVHQYNIRSGAYQVSRIPKDVAGTKNELANALRPKWDMNR